MHPKRKWCTECTWKTSQLLDMPPLSWGSPPFCSQCPPTHSLPPFGKFELQSAGINQWTPTNQSVNEGTEQNSKEQESAKEELANPILAHQKATIHPWTCLYLSYSCRRAILEHIGALISFVHNAFIHLCVHVVYF